MSIIQGLKTSHSSHAGENWPYHEDKNGNMVPCASNSCSLHGGTDVMATSPEEATAKKYKTQNAWGWTGNVNNNDSNPTKPVSTFAQMIDESDWFFNAVDEQHDDSHNASMITEPSEKTTGTDDSNGNISDKQPDNSDETKTSPTTNPFVKKTKPVKKKLTHSKKTTKQKNAGSNAHIKYDENGHRLYGNGEHLFTFESGADTSMSKDEIYDETTPGFIEARNQYLSEMGLNVYDSPLYHKIDNNMSTVELAKQIFADCAMPETDSAVYDSIDDTGKMAILQATKKQKDALDDYAGIGYKGINITLEQKGKSPSEQDMFMYSSEHIKGSIRNLHALISKDSLTLKDDTILFRTRFCKRQHNKERGGEELNYYKAVSQSVKTGKDAVLTRPEFISTALRDNFIDPAYNSKDHHANKNGTYMETQYIIKAPAGTHGIALTDNMEEEFLIDKGYEVRVVGIYETSELSFRKSASAGRDSQFFFRSKPIIALEIVPKKNKTGKTGMMKTKN